VGLRLKEIERISFDVIWKIDKVELACAGDKEVSVFFGADEMIEGSEWAPLPPVRKQIETLMYVSNLPKGFIKCQSQIIREYFRELVDSKKYQSRIKIDLFRIEAHCQVRELVIPYGKSARKHNFILSCVCDWDETRGMNILCRNDKIIKVSLGDLAR